MVIQAFKEMGGFFSKVDVEAIEAVEMNTVDLILKLRKEELKIDSYVKNEILRALSVYSKQIEKEFKKGYFSYEKKSHLVALIREASEKLQHLPSTCHQYELDRAWMEKNLYEMKMTIFDIEKNITHNKTEDEECQQMFKIVVVYSQKLKGSQKKQLLKRNEEDSISILLLKLFLRLPNTKIDTILDKSHQLLDRVIRSFDTFSADNFNAFNVDDLKFRFLELKKKAEVVNQLVEDNILATEKKKIGVVPKLVEGNIGESRNISFAETLKRDFPKGGKAERQGTTETRVTNFLEKICEELEEYEKLVDKFCPPMGQQLIRKIQKQVNFLIKEQLAQVRQVDNETLLKKQKIRRKASHICEKLENIDRINKEINENLGTLKELDKKVSSIADSNDSFQDKKKILEILAEEVNQMNTNNHEVHIQKVEILNRIGGFIVLETIIYLRHIKKSLDRFKQYAQLFAFPKNAKIYESKKSELYRIEEGFCDLPKGNGYIENRVQQIREYLNEVTEILSARATNNQSIISDLEHLHYMQKEIQNADFSLPFTEKLRAFNEMRRRIETIHNCNTRIVIKKMEVRRQLQSLENAIYEANYPGALKELKEILNEHEKEAQQFSHSIESDIYKQKRGELFRILTHVNSMIVQRNANFQALNNLSETSKIVLELLKKTAQEVKDKNDRIQSLNSIFDKVSRLAASNVSCQRKATLLGTQYEEILKLKMLPNQPDEISNLLRDLDLRIECENSKVRLAEMGNRIESLKQEIINLERPCPNNVFIEKLNEIFYLKDTIDDMPEENTHKGQLLPELYKILHTLDENIAKAVVGRKESEKILELQDHFTSFNPEALGVEKNSVQFIRMIRQRAESFEDNVKNYLGSSDSVDYYVMHENLLRLLEELDKLTCENNKELLTEIVNTVTYIKDLIEYLKSSTCG